MFTEAYIYHSLEGGGHIAESEEHDKGFKKTLIGDEYSFPFVSFLNPNIVESPMNVNDCEVLGRLEFGILKDFRKERERVTNSNGMCVKVAIVLNRLKPWILIWCISFRHLWCKEEGGSLRGFGSANSSCR